ncbi:MAG: ATP-binding protein [Muribaculaceae bacterium]|nr:ATP-binding protein [Muribaculaceae bacterium]
MHNYIPRLLSTEILEDAKYFPVLVITGPRQSGKTSLCRHLYPDYTYVNLEDITNRAKATNDPTQFLESLGEAAIIDEVQRVPDLMSMIQVRVDENKKLRYVLTGSSNFSLLRTVTQSLAGRAALFTLLPLSFQEFPKDQLSKSINQLMWQGQYPGVIADKVSVNRFYSNYYNTYVERDLRDLLKLRNLLTFDKFVKLLAVRVGSEFNASALAREVGVSSNTISEWLSLLTTSYIAYTLPPYFLNISKRLTKMPKVYFYDTGLLCYLLGIESFEDIGNNPLRGAIFENLAMSELLKSRLNKAKNPNLYFYREKSGIEVDALLMEGGEIKLYEIKAGKTIRPEAYDNINAVKRTLNNILSSTIIFDGESFPPASINIRDI